MNERYPGGRRAPASRRNAVYGDATGVEYSLPSVAGIAAAVAILSASAISSAGWNTLQFALAGAVSYHVVAGAVGSALDSSQRHRSSSTPSSTPWERIVRSPVPFASLHLHPILVGAFYPPHLSWWGPACYLSVLGSVAVVRCVPPYLRRPAAITATLFITMTFTALPSPRLWEWLPPVLALSLVVAHSVDRASAAEDRDPLP